MKRRRALLPFVPLAAGFVVPPAYAPPPSILHAHAVLDNSQVERAMTRWGLPATIDTIRQLFPGTKIRNVDPPMLEIPDFLSARECEQVVDIAQWQHDNNATASEARNYLNYRVNQELSQGKKSSEAAALIGEQGLSEEELKAESGSGFRMRVAPEMGVLELYADRLGSLLGTGRRRFVRNDNLWAKPDRRTVIVRDHTVVYYKAGDGVPPHVDGKDATLLVYLADTPESDGGATVFPEIGVSVAPVRGKAMLYWSDKELLHYAAEVKSGSKWIMQMLIDFRYDPKMPTIDWETGRVLSDDEL